MTSTNQPPHEPATQPAHSDRAQEKYSRAFTGVGLSLLTAWITSFLPLPWMLVSGIAAITAIAFLVFLLVVAWPTERRRSAAVTAAIGIPACLIFAFSALISVLMYGPVKHYQDCVSSAITNKAANSCQDELPQSIASWLQF